MLMSCCFEILVLSVAQDKIKNKPGIGRYTRDVSCLLCCIVLLCEIATSTLFHTVYPYSSISCERKYWRCPLTLVGLLASSSCLDEHILRTCTICSGQFFSRDKRLSRHHIQDIKTNRKTNPRLDFVGLENWTKCWGVSSLKIKGFRLKTLKIWLIDVYQ